PLRVAEKNSWLPSLQLLVCARFGFALCSVSWFWSFGFLLWDINAHDDLLYKLGSRSIP
ncbi:unnamed protein product, partial [Musa banksii]